jgi:hypothetical protein
MGEKMSLVAYAESELDRIGMTDEDGYNGMMRKHLIHMVKEFADEGHSGFSASYALQCLKKLMKFKPLSPLTGEDEEWTDVTAISGVPHFQNKRCGSVFKDGKDGQAYDIDGKVFWEWYKDEDGVEHKTYYTSFESRVPVTFPYAVPDEPIYEYRYSDSEPPAPPQNESGLL